MSPSIRTTLRIYISDNSLLDLYSQQAISHNESVRQDPFPNAGFDLYVPESTLIYPNQTMFLDHRVHAEMVRGNSATAFWLCPRSSISRTPLLLANSQGVIDSGYRGPMIAALRHIFPNEPNAVLNRGTRIVQICAPDLQPFYVEIVGSLQELSTTQRGQGGFGSTGGQVNT